MFEKSILEFITQKNVDTEFGSDADESFDPHEHRKIKKPTTYMETMSHMLKGSLGAGLLAMPNAVSRMGIVFGAFGIMFIGALATYIIEILILAQYQVCKKYKRGYMAYPKTMRRAVRCGMPCLRWSANIFAAGVDVFLFIWQIGLCAIYYVFVAQNVKQICEYYGKEFSVRILICCCYPFLLVMSLIKDLKKLTPFSTIANICVWIGLILVFFYLIEDDIVVDDSKFKLKALDEIPVFIGITLFALEALGVVLALEYNMENPKEFTGLCGLFAIGMFIIISLYVTLGVFGYLKYGDDCKGSITLNLPEHEKKAQVAKLTFAAALFLSYPLQNFVAWQILWRKLEKSFPSKWADFLIRFVVASVPFGLAVMAPTLGAFMGLVGALTLSVVAIIFPAVLEMSIYYPNNYGIFKYKLIKDIFIIVFGVICCISGVYTSLLEMYEEYQ